MYAQRHIIPVVRQTDRSPDPDTGDPSKVSVRMSLQAYIVRGLHNIY